MEAERLITRQGLGTPRSCFVTYQNSELHAFFYVRLYPENSFKDILVLSRGVGYPHQSGSDGDTCTAEEQEMNIIDTSQQTSERMFKRDFIVA